MRRLQFSLRTLLIAVALLAIPLGWLGWQAKIVRERWAMRAKIEADGGYVGYADLDHPELFYARPLPWIRELLGDESIFYWRPKKTPEPDEVERFHHLFPEATIWPARENPEPASST